jgi:predicted RNA-binding protein (TIGR00451 family)
MEHPGLLKAVYVDDGAVKALLNGADLKKPGIKRMPESFTKGEVVEVRLLDTEIPFAIGVCEVDSTEIVPDAKGPGVKILHILRDEAWKRRDGF